MLRASAHSHDVYGDEMAIFMVVPSISKERIKGAMATEKEAGKIDFIDLPSGASFVSYHGTAQELSGLLGITDGTNGTGVVVAVSSYYGREAANIWDWVSSRWES